MLAAMDVFDLDATATAELVRTGQVSPRELVDGAIARTERHNPELGAVIIPLYDSARRTAGDPPDGPFRGVPILIKDIGVTIRGVMQTAGLRPLREAGRTAPVSSYLVTALERAGFIVLGTTNTSELGILPSAEPPAWPPTRNPHDLALTSGGSSGGAACAVAAGLVPIAHGSDGGGSIRIPSSCCGLFGLKPSRGRISFAPNHGDINGGLVNEHVLTRSVRDSAAVLDLLAGTQPGDPYSAPPAPASYLAEIATPPPPLRIGFETRRLMPDGTIADSHPDCVAAVAHAARLLSSLGHTVEPAEIPGLRDPEWVARFIAIWAVGVSNGLDEASRVLGRAIIADEVELLTYTLGELGRMITGPAYAAAWAWIRRAARRIAAFWTTHDLWLTPTVTEPPPETPCGSQSACSSTGPLKSP